MLQLFLDLADQVFPLLIYGILGIEQSPPFRVVARFQPSISRIAGPVNLNGVPAESSEYPCICHHDPYATWKTNLESTKYTKYATLSTGNMRPFSTTLRGSRWYRSPKVSLTTALFNVQVLVRVQKAGARHSSRAPLFSVSCSSDQQRSKERGGRRRVKHPSAGPWAQFMI